MRIDKYLKVTRLIKRREVAKLAIVLILIFIVRPFGELITISSFSFISEAGLAAFPFINTH